ncbi:PREDICTED: protein NLP6-like [Ipomoea nil]|uniref:protein NLP6-like n=1 Tax=Ipomoea nil TaxID=35883 RepID=UPI0009011924|nr:PREDICTED: protein NLP6-like [Ipomoea nil]
MENRLPHSDVNLFWKCKHSTLSLIEVEVGIKRAWIEEKSVTHPPRNGQCGFQGGAVVEFLEKEFGDTSNSLQPIIKCLEMVSLQQHGNNLERQLLDNIEWLGAELKKIVKLQRLAADSKKVRILPPLLEEAECGVMQLDSPCEPHIPKTHTISRWEKDYGITRQLLQQRFGMSRDDAAKTLKVSTSTLKRACRDFGINRWPNHRGKMPNCSLNQKQHVQALKKHKGIQSSPPPLQATNTSQCNSSMSVKVTYQNDTIRFPLSSSSTIIYLEEQLETKLKISLENMSIKYQDEEDEWITLTCDSELMHGMEVLRSCGKTVIRMMVTPKFN